MQFHFKKRETILPPFGNARAIRNVDFIYFMISGIVTYLPEKEPSYIPATL